MDENATPQLGYEQARDELVDVVKQLESGGLTLEASLNLWERGEQLAAVCQTWLDQARARLDAAAPGDETAPGADADER
ncbi:MAG TPA: exodeoxyribonuclease VII small subunit [Actinomycetes bacterium]|nr:exodeoxyribonuclease VII small subunit [Actinomycetes bacterium]